MANPRYKQFAYPQLPTHADGLRILSVAPGDFYDSLKCTLASKMFSERPKYVALSYTWGHSYPDMSTLPVSPNDAASSYEFSHQETNNSGLSPISGISPLPIATHGMIPPPLTINDQPFHIGHNLHLALLHLRSATHPLHLWVDAICINQADTDERNRQVSLMSFIYTRAVRVAAWIGTRHYPSSTGLFGVMRFEWKAGDARHLAASIANGETMRWSRNPSPSTVARVAESAYWTRLWIVQEVCLPRLLALVFGSEIWTCEDFQQSGVQPAIQQGLTASVAEDFGPMRRLLETRDRRHTDMMTLESLMERFASNGCGELRDRVYGLLGCANDALPSLEVDDSGANAGSEVLFTRRRGMGSLRVDYSRSFYQIWTSIVMFAFFQAKSVEGRLPIQVISSEGQTGINSGLEERRISIVRIAGIAQKALGYKIEEEDEFARLGYLSKQDSHPTVIRAMGYAAGEIVRLGPDHSSLIGSSSAQQDWKSCWTDYCDENDDLETLRRIDEEYAVKMLSLEERDVRRIRDIQDTRVTAWPVSQGYHPPENPDPSSHPVTEDNDDNESQDAMRVAVDAPAEKKPRICLGTGHVIGLVPPATQIGDVIVRFWNCDAAIVMRSVADTSSPRFMLVGRADIAEVVDRSSTPGRDPHAEQCMSGAQVVGFRGDSPQIGAVYVDLSLRTLQTITSHIFT